jgi:hypothetical protein
MIGKELDTYIQNKVKEILEDSKYPCYDEVCTDTLSEIIDKLIIVHIRYWHLENAMSNAKTDEELVMYRKKSESLFKEKRPMLVEGFDKLIFNILQGKNVYTPINVKKYENWGDEKKKECGKKL